MAFIGLLTFKLYALLSLPEFLTACTICACSTTQAQNTRCAAVLVVGVIPDISVIAHISHVAASHKPALLPPPPHPLPPRTHFQCNATCKNVQNYETKQMTTVGVNKPCLMVHAHPVCIRTHCVVMGVPGLAAFCYTRNQHCARP